MLRQSLACCVIFVTLAACEQETRIGALQARAPSAAPGEIPETVLITGSLVGAPAAKLAYTHNLAIEMADEMVAPRFERGRNACLDDRSLNCNLLEASITVGNPNAGIRPAARLSVRLPHDSVARYETCFSNRSPEKRPANQVSGAARRTRKTSRSKFRTPSGGSSRQSTIASA